MDKIDNPLADVSHGTEGTISALSAFVNVYGASPVILRTPPELHTKWDVRDGREIGFSYPSRIDDGSAWCVSVRTLQVGQRDGKPLR